MKNQTKSFLVLLLIATSLLYITSIGVLETKSQIPTPVFNISFLTPNTSTERLEWSALIAQEIAKIGINVAYIDERGWGDIAPRTWSYPFIYYDYIPTYAAGGFDTLFVGFSWDLDWDPTDFYSTISTPPFGTNYYQYHNVTYNILHNQYMEEYDNITRTSYAHQMQAILYDDLPAIGILYLGDLFGFRTNLVGFDTFLLTASEHRSENWDDPDNHIIHYAVPGDFFDRHIFEGESFSDLFWMQNVYSGLFKRGQNHHSWEPVIAKNVSVIPHRSYGLNATVFLDPNAKFSDGNPVLPEDVKYSYELHMTPEVSSNEFSWLQEWFSGIHEIEVINNIPGGEMRFHLRKLTNFPLKMLSLDIIDKSEVEPLISTYGYSIFDEIPGTGNVGWSLVKSCGPFMLQSIDYTNGIAHMVPNPFWNNNTVSGGQQPHLTDIYEVWIPDPSDAFAELLLNNIDIMDASFVPDPIIFEGHSSVEGVLSTSLHPQEMSINMKHPILGTGELTPLGTSDAARKIRQAISHAIPRQTIIDDILNGTAFPGILGVPNECIGFDSTLQPYSYDIPLALQLMEQAGYVSIISEYTEFNILLIVVFGIVSIYAIRRTRK
ncbi:MAG: hypothetical protein H7645_03045 [Candidatus Heimdallarchaeota archaeon]|nr:hypothetical protein [Candidatus Heimdallarchaeota archaeon]MCK4769293.1 hypothetical protein [Candidatus Heimdallarchaeota archaeon]